jgi:hypothetical protein
VDVSIGGLVIAVIEGLAGQVPGEYLPDHVQGGPERMTEPLALDRVTAGWRVRAPGIPLGSRGPVPEARLTADVRAG